MTDVFSSFPDFSEFLQSTSKNASNQPTDLSSLKSVEDETRRDCDKGIVSYIGCICAWFCMFYTV